MSAANLVRRGAGRANLMRYHEAGLPVPRPLGAILFATLVVLVRWAALWQFTEPIFALGGILVLVLFLCLALMVPLLIVTRMVLIVIQMVRTAFGHSQ